MQSIPLRSLPLVTATLVAAAALASCASERVFMRSTLRASLVAETTIPHGMLFDSTVVGGLSGIDRAPDGTWYLLSDDRSNRGLSRFYTADIDIVPPSIDVRFRSVVPMRGRYGKFYAQGEIDPEAIRFDSASNALWFTSEGDESRLVDPAITRMSLDGTWQTGISLPPMFRMDTVNESGPRGNGVFEGLCISADGSHLIVSLEEPLKHEGYAMTRSTNGPIRISFFDRPKSRLMRQILYAPELAPQTPDDSTISTNGVVEVLPFDATWLFVLERAYTPGLGNTVRLFIADISSATDVKGHRSTSGLLPAYARKLLVADFAELGLSRLDNIEGMSWGPTLADGRRTLVFVSDDNFNPSQVTQLVVLALSGMQSD